MRAARIAVTAFAAECGFGGQALEDIALGVGEALANAFEHGGGGLSVAVAFCGDTLSIDVRDGGAGFDSAAVISLTPDLALRGFGSSIMRAVMDDVAYAEGGRRLRLQKRTSRAVDGRLVERQGG